MAQSVLDIVSQVSAWVVEAFFNLEGVRQHILPGLNEKAYRDQTVHGLRTLFLRWARPARVVFLSTPRGTPARRNMLAAYRREIGTLRSYYEGDDEARRKLVPYLRSGSWTDAADQVAAAAGEVAQGAKKVASAAKVVRPDLAKGGELAADIVEHAADKAQQASWAKMADSFDEVDAEIREDCEAFGDYLQNSVFHAASFAEYCMQELERIRMHLQQPNGARRGIREEVIRAYIHRDPAVSSLLQGRLADVEHARQVIARLADVRTALADLEQSAA